MTDDEIRSRFDGRGRVEISGGADVRARAEPIAYALGYELVRAERSRGPGGVFGLPDPVTVRLFFRRDDDPRARRRAERTIERLRAGGPVSADEPPPAPPPPPGPPPPHVHRPPAPRPRRSMEPQPPPPVGPPRPRVPPRPAYPPPPPPLPE